MDLNGGGSRVAALAEDLANEYVNAAEREKVAAGLLAHAREDRTALERALRALAPDHDALPPKPEARQRAKPTKVKAGGEAYPDSQHPDRLEAVWTWARQQTEPFTQAEACVALRERGVGRSAVEKALPILRNAEALRFMGKVPMRGGKTDRYALLDDEAGYRVCEVNRERYRGPGLRKASA